jgi:hypothetical protein
MAWEQLTHQEHARILTAALVAAMGVVEIVAPWLFWCTSVYFKGARAALPPDQRERLARVLAEREEAEANTGRYSRYAGIFTLVIAPLTILPAVPFVLPYSLFCLAMAGATLLSYLHFRRATQRRVAPLLPRNPWASLPPVGVAATAICLLGAALFAVYPQYRLGVIVVIASSVVLLVIAWRVAVAPALLLGNDSQLEYVVDEHLRYARATNLLTLACAPPLVLVEIATATLPPAAHFYNAVTVAVWVAFFTMIAVNVSSTRKRLKIA